MKKIFFYMGLMVLLCAPFEGHTASCYITPTNDYICDAVNGTDNEGRTVQRDSRNNVPGSDYVFQGNGASSQYDWLPGVIIDLNTDAGDPVSGTPTAGDDIAGGGGAGGGVVTSSAPECVEGEDAYEQFKNLILSREGSENCSYYDGVGNPSNCAYGRSGSVCSGCGSCGGCLTIGAGHLVKSGEPYTPCGTCVSDAEVAQLLDDDASRFWTSVQSHLGEACVSGEGCFGVAIGSVLYQGGTNFLRGTFSGTWADIKNGDYEKAANRLNGSTWQQQTPTRVADFQSALREMQARKDAGENLGCG